MTQGGKLFDHYAGEYRETVQHSIAFSGLSAEFFARMKAAAFRSLLPKPSTGPAGRLRVLDVGCGVGELNEVLADEFPRLIDLLAVVHLRTPGLPPGDSRHHRRVQPAGLPCPGAILHAGRRPVLRDGAPLGGAGCERIARALRGLGLRGSIYGKSRMR